MLTRRRNFAPIALFVFKRPEHTRRMILSLQACTEFAESPVYVFADGPRSAEDLEGVIAARHTARTLLGHDATYVESDTNKGLAVSVIEGVSDVCERHGKVIVVEDDLIVADTFLTFLNEGLNRYSLDKRVMQISGHMFNVPELKDSDEALLLPFVTSWGWATWQRAWKLLDCEVAGWEAFLRDPLTRNRFDLNGHYPYSRMLRRQMEGNLDSWAIRWYYSVFNNQGLSLFPPRTLVHNTGLDGSGTHSSKVSQFREPDLPLDTNFICPDKVEESRYKKDVYAAFRKTLLFMRMRKVASTVSRFGSIMKKYL